MPTKTRERKSSAENDKRMEELKEKEDVSLVGLYKLNPSLDPKRLVSTLEPIT